MGGYPQTGYFFRETDDQRVDGMGYCTIFWDKAKSLSLFRRKPAPKIRGPVSQSEYSHQECTVGCIDYIDNGGFMGFLEWDIMNGMNIWDLMGFNGI